MPRDRNMMPGDEVADGATKGKVVSRGATRARGYEVTVRTDKGDRTYRNDDIDQLRRINR